MTVEEQITDKVRRLSEDKQLKVLSFVEAIAVDMREEPKRRLRLDWSGGLREYKDRYTSVELQKKAMDWRLENLGVKE